MITPLRNKILGELTLLCAESLRISHIFVSQYPFPYLILGQASATVRQVGIMEKA